MRPETFARGCGRKALLLLIGTGIAATLGCHGPAYRAKRLERDDRMSALIDHHSRRTEERQHTYSDLYGRVYQRLEASHDASYAWTCGWIGKHTVRDLERLRNTPDERCQRLLRTRPESIPATFRAMVH